MTTKEPWKTRGLRLSFFRGKLRADEVIPSFKEVAGSNPDERSERQGGLQINEIGPFGPGRLHISVNQARIDINWIATPTNDDLGELGDIREASKVLLDRARNWIVGSPGFVRVAFGANLGKPSSEHGEALAKLADYLPKLGLDPHVHSDLVYQVNRRLDVGDLQINCIAKWAVNQYINNQFQVGPSGELIPASSLTRFDAGCELDYSSPIESHNLWLGGEQSFGLLVKFAELAAERSDEGER